MVDIADIVDADNIGRGDMAEVANLAASGLLQALSGAAENDLGRKAEGAQVANTVLGRLGLFSSERTGTRLTNMRQKLSSPTRNWNCRRASKKTLDSMSPTVPPTSMRQTSAASPESSTGT